jgi:hypothetical protein
MIEDKLISQWGVWFIYKGDSYEGNVSLITTIGSMADLAYLWLQTPIASLSNYFLNENNKQKSYAFPHLATSSESPPRKSTPSSSSRKASSLSGRTSRIRREGASSSRWVRPSPRRSRSTKSLPSSCWERISTEATRSTASVLSHPRSTTPPATVSKSG